MRLSTTTDPVYPKATRLESLDDLGDVVLSQLAALPRKLGRKATVLVPKEAIAHELRRRIISEPNGAALLSGIVFRRPESLAQEVCAYAGRPCIPGLETCWPIALDHLIRTQALASQLTYFRQGHLTQYEAYPYAIAHALLTLESAGIDPDRLEVLLHQLPDTSRARLRDLWLFRKALDELLADVPSHWMSTPACLQLAAQLLEHTSPTNRLNVLCSVSIGPNQPEHTTLLAASQAKVLCLQTSSLQTIHEIPISIHGGIEDELEASLAWLEQQMVEANLDLGQIGIVCAQANLALPLARRIQDLLGGQLQAADVLADGLPLLASQPGMLINLALEAVEKNLLRQSLADFLVAAKAFNSATQAIEMIQRLAVLGGEPNSWSIWQYRILKHTDQTDPIRKFILPLVAISQGLEKETSFADLVDKLLSLMRLIDETTADDQSPRASLTEILFEISQNLSPISAHLFGRMAFGHIKNSLVRHKLHQARFGRPRPYVGAPESLAGLSFSALRFIGLAEGSIPQSDQDDPVLPDFLRQELRHCLPASERCRLPLQAELGLRTRMAADACVVASKQVWASAAIQQIDGQQLEPSTYLFELYNRSRNQSESLDANIVGIEFQRHVQSTLDAQKHWRTLQPNNLRRQALLIQSTGSTNSVPSVWLAPGPQGIDRISALESQAFSSDLSPLNGLLTDRQISIPGLSEQQGLAITGLIKLLRCPMRFAYELLVGLHPAQDFAPAWRLDPKTSGIALHQITERFFKEFGQEFLKASDRLVYKQQLRDIAQRVLDAVQYRYALQGQDIQQRERQRMVEMSEGMLGYYSRRKDLVRFLFAEHWLGERSTACHTDHGTLHLRGKIDLVLASSAGMVIHDLKSGRLPNQTESETFHLSQDLQPLVYDACYTDACLPAVVEVALIYPQAGYLGLDRRLEGERLQAGRLWARRWLSIAHHLLLTRTFAALPDDTACTTCPMVPRCDAQSLMALNKKLHRLHQSHARSDHQHTALLNLWRLHNQEPIDDDGI